MNGKLNLGYPVLEPLGRFYVAFANRNESFYPGWDCRSLQGDYSAQNHLGIFLRIDQQHSSVKIGNKAGPKCIASIAYSLLRSMISYAKSVGWSLLG